MSIPTYPIAVHQADNSNSHRGVWLLGALVRAWRWRIGLIRPRNIAFVQALLAAQAPNLRIKARP